MLYDCKLNGRLSSNVDGHVDNYLLMLCSMPLTIIVRLVFNIKKNPAMNNMFKNTLSSSLSCLLPHRCIHTHYCFHIVLCNWTFCIDHCKYYYLCILYTVRIGKKKLFSMLHNLLIDTLSALKSFENTVKA